MVQLCVLGFVLFFACYGQFESGLSAYARRGGRDLPLRDGDRAGVRHADVVVSGAVRRAEVRGAA